MDWLLLLVPAIWIALGVAIWLELRKARPARDDHPPRAGRTMTEERLEKMRTEHGDAYPSYSGEWKHHNEERERDA